ncbi:MAG: tetratricopeptide repeat protein [Desulfobacteraceae bacterium]|nr:tetratricopeptide repeat protein [Desulfobacteraceae bacterium]
MKSIGGVLAIVFSLLLFCAQANPAAAADPWKKKIDEAIAFQKEKQYEQALKAAGEALAIARDRFGASSPQAASTLSRIANIHAWNRDREAALEYARQALEVARKTYGSADARTAFYIQTLAGSHANLQDFDKAVPLYREALGIIEKTRGPDDAGAATILTSLAYIDQRRKNFVSAEALGLRALAIRKKAFGEDHNYVAESSMFLARMYRDQGRYADALAMYEQALGVWKRQYPSGHNRVVALERTIANLKTRQSDAKTAPAPEVLVSSPISGPEASQPPGWDEEIAAIRLLIRQGKTAEALVAAVEAGQSAREKFGDNHPSVAEAIALQARCYLEKGDEKTAERLYRGALDIRRSAHGPEADETALAMEDLGYLFMRQGRLEEAEALYRRAFAILTERHGPNSAPMKSRKDLLARLQGELQKPAKQPPARAAAPPKAPPRKARASRPPRRDNLLDTIARKVKRLLSSSREKSAPGQREKKSRPKSNGQFWPAIFFLAAFAAFLIGFLGSMRTGSPSKRTLSSTRRPALKPRKRPGQTGRR